MSEYRRFISYMYAYDNGIKNKNVGFAKTECRGETVKLWINLKGAYSQEENYKVYFFVRRDGSIVGICMGDMVIKSGMGQFFAAEPLTDIEIPFDDICGLYIGGKPGERMFASQWDDMPFDTKRVMGMEAYKAVLSAREAEHAEKERTVNEREAGEQKIGEAAVKAVTGKQAGEDNAANAGVGKEPESRGVAATIEPPVWEKPIKMVYISDGERITRSENAPEMDSAMTNEETAGKETVKNEQELHASEETEYPGKHSKLDMLFDGKEPVLAFSEDDIYDCVDIGLDELPKIDTKDSSLINNSFVNHGYFNFHHLLLGKKDGNTLVIGVPGIYNRREKITANMFGFEKFKFSMRSDVCMNHFGYWYKEYQYS